MHRCLNWHVYQCNNQHPWKRRRRRRFQSCWRAKKAETHLRHKTRSRQRCIFLHKQRERESKLSIHSKVLNWFELKLCPCLQTFSSLILYFLFFFFLTNSLRFSGKSFCKRSQIKDFVSTLWLLKRYLLIYFASSEVWAERVFFSFQNNFSPWGPIFIFIFIAKSFLFEMCIRSI